MLYNTFLYADYFLTRGKLFCKLKMQYNSPPERNMASLIAALQSQF